MEDCCKSIVMTSIVKLDFESADPCESSRCLLAFKRCRSQHPCTFSFVSMVGLNFKCIACPSCINFWTVREEENIISLLLGSGGRRENDRVRDKIHTFQTPS